ncbi:MAG TPA: hypothetical protein VK932_10250 [Kofleriaceae bacterium]|nr:hypothetical protein [Kofleriaceae bacterium]
MNRRALAPLATLLFVILPIPAAAAPKVAVTPIDGDTESEIRDVLAEAVDGDEFKLVSKKETSRAVDKIDDLADLSEKDARKLAKDLSADAIIAGTLTKDGANKTLKIKLFVNGKAKKGFTIKFKKASSPKFKEAIRKKVAEKLEGTTEAAAAVAEEAPAAKPKKGDKGAKGEKAAKAAKAEKPAKGEKAAKGAKAAKGEDDEEKAEDDGEKPEKAAKGEDDDEESEKSEDDEEGKKAAPAKTAALPDGDEEDDPSITRRAKPQPRGGRSANRATARIDVGASMVKRSMTFNSNLPSNLAPRPFRPDPVPGTRVEGELYPLGFAIPDSILSPILGIAFKLDRTLQMNVGTSDEPGTKIPTDQFRYSIGARARIVGRSPTSPSVTLGVDIGRSRFRPDRSVLMPESRLDLPDTYYKFLAPGLGFRIPIGGFLAFFARGEGWIVQDAGMIVRSYSYGRAKVLGFDGEGGLDIVIAQRFGLRLSGGFTQIGYEFTGVGGFEANSRDGNPSTFDVGGAADRMLHAAATIAVIY